MRNSVLASYEVNCSAGAIQSRAELRQTAGKIYFKWMPLRASLVGDLSEGFQPNSKLGPTPKDNLRSAPGEPDAQGNQADQLKALDPASLAQEQAAQEIEARPKDEGKVATEDGNSKTDVSGGAIRNLSSYLIWHFGQ